MDRILVVFSNNRCISRSEAASLKKYAFLYSGKQCLSVMDRIMSPDYTTPMIVIQIDKDVPSLTYAGMCLKLLRIYSINDRIIYPTTELPPIEKPITVSLEEAREWYNGPNPTLKALALKAFSASDLELDWDTVKEHMNYKVVDQLINCPKWLEKRAKAFIKLEVIAKYFNGDWKKQVAEDGFFISNRSSDTIGQNTQVGEYYVNKHSVIIQAELTYFKRIKDAMAAIRMMEEDIKYLF